MHIALLGASFAFIGIAITAVAFVAAARSKPQSTYQQSELPVAKPIMSRIPLSFVHTVGSHPSQQALIDLCLQQLEEYVRLEHEVAEAFVVRPTCAELHRKTTSPFLN